MLWGALGVIIAASVAVAAWRLAFQKQQAEIDSKTAALLESADKFVREGRDGDAEAEARKVLGLIPGDARAREVIDRINTKRDMIHKKEAETSGLSMMRAAQLEKENIAAAIEAYDAIQADTNTTKEAKQAAADRTKALGSGLCTLLLPEDWPADGELAIDGLSKNAARKTIDGIVYGKRIISITRFGYRAPAPMEIEFRTLEPVRLPAFEWKLKGAKVFVTSTPPGAAVWQNGRNTGKVTPCEFDDVDEGRVEYELKHYRYPATTVSGEVEGRLPLKLSANFKSK
jgi:hypothetical protein